MGIIPLAYNLHSNRWNAGFSLVSPKLSLGWPQSLSLYEFHRKFDSSWTIEQKYWNHSKVLTTIDFQVSMHKRVA